MTVLILIINHHNSYTHIYLYIYMCEKVNCLQPALFFKSERKKRQVCSCEISIRGASTNQGRYHHMWFYGIGITTRELVQKSLKRWHPTLMLIKSKMD